MWSFPEFTIGFPVWLFSTPMVPNVQTASQPSSPLPKQHQPHVNPKVDALPSSLIFSSSISSSSPSESLDSSNEEAKKKKNKQNNQGGNQATAATYTTSMEKPFN